LVHFYTVKNSFTSVFADHKMIYRVEKLAVQFICHSCFFNFLFSIRYYNLC